MKHFAMYSVENGRNGEGDDYNISLRDLDWVSQYKPSSLEIISSICVFRNTRICCSIFC